MPILTAVAFTVALGFGIVAPDIPAFARHFGVSTAAAASVVSAFALMRIVGALPAGRLVDRFGEPAVMAVGHHDRGGEQHPGRVLRLVRRAHHPARRRWLGSAMFGVSAQTLLLVSVPSEQRGRASGLCAWRLPGRRDQRPGARRAHRRLVDAGALHHLRLPAHRSGRHRRGRAAGRVPPPHRGARLRAAQAFAEIGRALRDRAYRAAAAANLADGFAALRGPRRHRAAVRPRRAAAGRRSGRASGSAWSPS